MWLIKAMTSMGLLIDTGYPKENAYREWMTVQKPATK